jgi:hypothetical protein
MRLLIGHDATVAEWVGNRIGVPVAPPYTALGWIDGEGTLKAGFVFYGYAPGGNIDIAVALSGRLTRGMLAAVADYVFRQIPATRMTARAIASNDKACAMLKRAGFVQECICKAYYGADDAVQFRMLKREATRWLP